LAKNKKSLLIVADNSLQWLQYLLRMRWQCPELSFLGLDSVKLTLGCVRAWNDALVLWLWYRKMRRPRK
jgi:hypothetical protein